MDLTKINMDSNTSTSLLTMATKSTIDVIDDIDEKTGERNGQYIEFIVSGHQQTSTMAFHVQGQMDGQVQEMNHYLNTWGFMDELRKSIHREIMFLEMTE